MIIRKTGYYVIGGQYEDYCYGWSRTVLGAKRMARKHQELWDNWQGWHTPKVYAAEDCAVGETFHGEDIVRDREGGAPLPVAQYAKGKWYDGNWE